MLRFLLQCKRMGVSYIITLPLALKFVGPVCPIYGRVLTWTSNQISPTSSWSACRASWIHLALSDLVPWVRMLLGAAPVIIDLRLLI